MEKELFKKQCVPENYVYWNTLWTVSLEMEENKNIYCECTAPIKLQRCWICNTSPYTVPKYVDMKLKVSTLSQMLIFVRTPTIQKRKRSFQNLTQSD
jgi:hypothetical protein